MHGGHERLDDLHLRRSARRGSLSGSRGRHLRRPLDPLVGHVPRLRLGNRRREPGWNVQTREARERVREADVDVDGRRRGDGRRVTHSGPLRRARVLDAAPSALRARRRVSRGCRRGDERRDVDPADHRLDVRPRVTGGAGASVQSGESRRNLRGVGRMLRLLGVLRLPLEHQGEIQRDLLQDCGGLLQSHGVLEPE